MFTPVVFINCKEQPFLDRIMNGTKVYETRTRNTLGNLLGERVLLAETGHGKPTVRCSARIECIISVHVPEYWERYRKYLGIDSGSRYDWHPDTRIKWLYRLTDVRQVEPFTPDLGRRHGRVWAEYYEGEE